MNILIDGQTFGTPEINRGIGVYLKELLARMVKMSYAHNWYIAVGEKELLSVLDPWVAQQLIPIEDKEFAPSGDGLYVGCYTDLLKKAIQRHHIDLYWNPNPLMINVLFPYGDLGIPIIATLFDLIPLVRPIDSWSSALKKEYDRRLRFLQEEDVHLLCISSSCESDFHRLVNGQQPTQVTALAANHELFYKPRTTPGISDDPIMLFTGGFDPRKNLEGAVGAFALARKQYPELASLQKLRMFIVCDCLPEQKEAFEEQLAALDLSNNVVLTGYIPDEELADLYGRADLFFFPSFYEGFGLPILEAMLGGTYILSADNSSLPSVCGGHALLCRADDVENMAKSLVAALEAASNESVLEKEARQAYALTYHWDKTATQSLLAIEKSRLPPRRKDAAQLKIAMVTPWPHQKTGIANYIYQLTCELGQLCGVDVFVDFELHQRLAPEHNPAGSLYPIEELHQRHQNYDHIVYQIGNSSDYHTRIYEYLLRYPGIAELHDYVLHPFFYHSFYLNNKKAIYAKALETGYQEEGADHYQMIEKGTAWPDNFHYPMCHSISAISRATIVHNKWCQKNLQKCDNVHVIPLASFPRPSLPPSTELNRQNRLRQKIGLKSGECLIGCFGFVNHNKRPKTVVDAVSQLIAKKHPVRLIFFGECNYDEIIDYIAGYDLQESVKITGFLHDDEYEAGMKLCDVVVNLRYPSMGESSATLCDAFNQGKAVLVSDVNQYTEFPDDVCWKVPVDQFEVPILVGMLEWLITNRDVREDLGDNAKNYAASVLPPQGVAQQYLALFEQLQDAEACEDETDRLDYSLVR